MSERDMSALGKQTKVTLGVAVSAFLLLLGVTWRAATWAEAMSSQATSIQVNIQTLKTDFSEFRKASDAFRAELLTYGTKIAIIDNRIEMIDRSGTAPLRTVEQQMRTLDDRVKTLERKP